MITVGSCSPTFSERSQRLEQVGDRVGEQRLDRGGIGRAGAP